MLHALSELPLPDLQNARRALLSLEEMKHESEHARLLDSASDVFIAMRSAVCRSIVSIRFRLRLELTWAALTDVFVPISRSRNFAKYEKFDKNIIALSRAQSFHVQIALIILLLLCLLIHTF